MKTLILLFFAFGMSAHAQIIVGNGGHSVHCVYSGYETYEAFDLYEGAILSGYKYDKSLDGRDPLELARELARKLDAVQTNFDGSKTSAVSIENKVNFVANAMNFLPAGVGLEPTKDSQEFIRLPDHCEMLQAVNFRNSNRIYVVSDIWNKLSNMNKAALYLHEAVYWYLRETGVEKDSRRARKAVAHLMSGQPVVSRTELPNWLRTVQYCHSVKKGSHDWSTAFLAYRDLSGNVVVQLLQVGGFRMLSKALMYGSVPNAPELPIDANVNASLDFTSQVDSPIDFDAIFKLSWGRGRVAIGGLVQPGDALNESVTCEARSVR